MSICQRVHHLWAAAKRLHTLDVEDAEEMLTTSKKVYVHHVVTELLLRCANTAGQRKLTVLKLDFPGAGESTHLANNHLLIELW